MSESTESSPPTALISMSIQQLLRVALMGAVVGVATWGLTLLLDIYVFKAIVCQGTNSMQCQASSEYATISASILAGGAGLFGLARMQVFRSLLVVVAATASLWGLEVILQAWDWRVALPLSLVLFALAYSLFAWVARLRSFVMALVVVAVLGVIIRLVLNL